MVTKKPTKICLGNFETSPELAEVKVIYKSKPREKVKISSSRDAYEIFYQIFDKDTIEYQEQFYLLLLNRANFMLGWIKLGVGGTDKALLDVKIIYTLALLTNCSGIIICHNHPSGTLTPSVSDIDITKKIKQAGNLLEISLLDHLIMGHEGCYYSFADEGKL